MANVEVRGLKDWDEYEEMLTVVAAGFGQEVQAVRRRFERHPPYQLENTRGTIADGRIVSVVHVHALRVRGRDGETWLMGGIGEVCTPPDYRRRGYATMALEDSITLMERLGCDFSMLGTGSQSFYERLGWRTYPRTFLTFDPKKVALPEEPPGDLEVREIDWESDPPALKRIYEEYNRDRVGPLVRSQEHWRDSTSRRRRSGSSWIALRTGAPVAYLWGAAQLRILELPHLDGEQAASGALLLHALRVGRKESFKQVVLDEAICPQASDLTGAQSYGSVGPDEAVSRTENTNTMLRPVRGFSIDFAPGELVYYGTDSF